MQITEQLIQSFLLCPYKMHLLLKGAVGQKSDYEILQDDLCSAYLSEVLRTDNGQSSIAKHRGSNKGRKLITGVQVAYGELSSSCDITVENDEIRRLGDIITPASK
jgi:hypothetical protein